VAMSKLGENRMLKASRWKVKRENMACIKLGLQSQCTTLLNK